MKPLVIVEAPSNLGLIEPAPGKEPGVRNLPAHLKANGFYDLVKAEQVVAVPPPAYSMKYDAESGVRNADEIAAYSLRLAKQVGDQVGNGKFPLVIGGDCSVLIGCMLALKHAGDYGLFFIDGHTDFVMPGGSRTKGAAGMDLAIVTGYGHKKLTDIGGQKPYVRETHVLAYGNRCEVKEYVDEILNSDIRYEDLKSVRRKGAEEIAKRFLAMLEEAELNGFWIHLDVDVLDSTIMPCVDSPQPGGLTYAELKQLLKILLRSKRVSGMNIGILDPDLDASGGFARHFAKEIGILFGTGSASADFKS
jgi:arginase